MAKTKKGLSLAEVVVIIEVIFAVAAVAVVAAFGSTINSSAIDNLIRGAQYALYAATFSAVNLGGFNLGTITVVISAFIYLNLIVLVALVVKVAKTKLPRHFIALVGYLIGVIMAVMAASYFLSVARPILTHISVAKKALVVGMTLFCMIIYLMSAFAAVLALVSTLKTIEERKEAKKEAERKEERGAELEEKQKEIDALERRVAVLEAALIKGVKQEKVVVVEKVVEKEPEPAPAPVEEPAPAPVEEPVVEAEEKEAIERVPFVDKLLKAEKDLKNKYNELKAYLLSFGVKSRVSVSGDAFRAHKETYAIISIAGKHLKVYLPLDVKDYEGSTIPVVDVSHFKKYQDTPLAINVRSDLSVKRAKILILDVMKQKDAKQGEVVEKNYAAQVIKGKK